MRVRQNFRQPERQHLFIFRHNRMVFSSRTGKKRVNRNLEILKGDLSQVGYYNFSNLGKKRNGISDDS